MLRALEQTVVEIGSHTITHADLPSLDDAQADGVSRARNLPVVPILPPRAAVNFFRTKRG